MALSKDSEFYKIDVSKLQDIRIEHLHALMGSLFFTISRIENSLQMSLFFSKYGHHYIAKDKPLQSVLVGGLEKIRREEQLIDLSKQLTKKLLKENPDESKKLSVLHENLKAFQEIRNAIIHRFTEEFPNLTNLTLLLTSNLGEEEQKLRIKNHQQKITRDVAKFVAWNNTALKLAGEVDKEILDPMFKKTQAKNYVDFWNNAVEEIGRKYEHMSSE